MPVTIGENLLQRMRILPPAGKAFHVLVTDFKGHKQLNDRIAELVERTGVRPRTLDDIPARSRP